MSRPSDPNARAKFLAAAAEVFAARGLAAAKVEDIAASAGLSKGSFYLHFESKDHAFRHLVEEMLTLLKARVEALPEGLQGSGSVSFEEHLQALVEHDTEMFDFLWTNRALVGLLLDGGQCADYHHLVECFYDEAAAKTRRLLTSGIKAGIYRVDLDIDIASAFISGAYDRLARQIVRAPVRPDLRKMLCTMQDLVMRAVGSAATLERLAAIIATASKPSPVRAPAPQRRRPAPVSKKNDPSSLKARKREPR